MNVPSVCGAPMSAVILRQVFVNLNFAVKSKESKNTMGRKYCNLEHTDVNVIYQALCKIGQQELYRT